MKVLPRFGMLLTALSLAGCASIEPTRSSGSPVFSQDVPFEMGRSCFSGIRASYDDWMAELVRRNEDVNLDTLQVRFPQTDYEDYKRDLNCNYIAYPVGNLEVRGIYVRPKVQEGGDLPVLIVNRGGNGPSGTWNFMRMFQRVLPLARAGYIVIGSQYRGSRRGGDPAIYGADEFGGADIDDVLALVDLIDSLPGADESRIGMYGWSRGGMMALLAATRTDRLRVIAVGGTPTDLAAELEIRPEMERVFRARIPNYDENKQAVLKARSAVYWADQIDTDLPILILHGERDARVSLKSAQDLARVLQEQQHPHKLVVYEDGSHSLLQQNREVVDELRMWFDAHLAGEDRRR